MLKENLYIVHTNGISTPRIHRWNHYVTPSNRKNIYMYIQNIVNNRMVSTRHLPIENLYIRRYRWNNLCRRLLNWTNSILPLTLENAPHGILIEEYQCAHLHKSSENRTMFMLHFSSIDNLCSGYIDGTIFQWDMQIEQIAQESLANGWWSILDLEIMKVHLGLLVDICCWMVELLKY